MRSTILLFLALASCSSPGGPQPVETPDPKWNPPLVSNLERDVRFLADDELKGRNNGTPEGFRAADYVANQMRKIGLAPGGENDTFFQDVNLKGEIPTRNVIGILKGESDEMVVLGAHHDHLGAKGDKIFNGADDNASGVAVILEAARRILAGPKPRRSVLFCSFDAEEDGLIGSRAFVASGLYPPEKFVSMLCFDLVGGHFMPGDESRVFALGSESSPELFDWIGKAKAPGLDIGRAGIYLIEPMGSLFPRSDYASFRTKKVPFVFFSTGTPWYYHTPADDVDKLDFAKMSRLVDLVVAMSRDLADAPGRPVFTSPNSNLVEDAELMFQACRRILTSKDIQTNDDQKKKIKLHIPVLKKIIETEGRPDKNVRESLQKVMVEVFTIAAGQAPPNR